MTYAVITFIALLFLNVYCSIACQRLFYDNKENALTDKAQLAASELEKLDELTPSAVSAAVSRIHSLKVTRLLVTDRDGNIILDTDSQTNQSTALPEQITQAISGGEAFNWTYRDGITTSQAACAITQGNKTIGCIYLLDRDAQQGHLLRTIRTTILTTTLILELVVIAFSIAFAYTFSKRLSRIMTSMRIIQEGDFSHKVVMNGNDELTILADEFNDLSERLQTSENKRRQFVSDASHELKTPLASIKLLAETILQNDMDMETLREFVSDIGDEADRLNRMSQKLLDLTRGEDVEVDESEIIYMAPTVERVCRMLSAQASHSQIQIITDLKNDVPILIREDDLYRILFNLVENGIKYNIPGGSLTISLDRTEEWGILKVSDTGTGIPEDAIGHIYERFYRVDKARSRASGGSGLGLSIVRNMVLRNQGKISVESTFGMGTTFTVKFMAFDTEEEELSL
jgi:signal transduction histidine kinase